MKKYIVIGTITGISNGDEAIELPDELLYTIDAKNSAEARDKVEQSLTNDSYALRRLIKDIKLYEVTCVSDIPHIWWFQGHKVENNKLSLSYSDFLLLSEELQSELSGEVETLTVEVDFANAQDVTSDDIEMALEDIWDRGGEEFNYTCKNANKEQEAAFMRNSLINKL